MLGSVWYGNRNMSKPTFGFFTQLPKAMTQSYILPNGDMRPQNALEPTWFQTVPVPFRLEFGIGSDHTSVRFDRVQIWPVRPNESTVEYKLSCPSCKKRVSRWFIFFEPVVYHRCRGCGVKFRTSSVSTLAFVALATLWFALERKHVISPVIALVLVLITLVLMICLVPYFTPVHQSDKTL